ncbi:MAG: ATP-binding cassette domain-containing protein [Verrucomicrobiota bacterium]
MLRLEDITYSIEKDDEDVDLIHKASLQVASGHFMAIVGPSGCGKTTLLKIVAGLYEESDGKIFWDGRDLAEEGDFDPAEIGYVPQFSIAYDHLTVDESVKAAVQLRVKTRSAKKIRTIHDSVLDRTGLRDIREKRVKVLSGGQKRRLGLALELVSNPRLLLCDEVTSGLDPKSEREIVGLLHELSNSDNRVVINVTHSLSNLELYDSILVLFDGRVVYHGPPDSVNHYFSVESAEEVYPRLTKRKPSNWHDSWRKHAASYYKTFGDAFSVDPVISDGEPDMSGGPKTEHLPTKSRLAEEEDLDEEEEDDIDEIEDGPSSTPGRLSQFLVLLGRRWKIFSRDRVQLLLTLAMLLGFPIIVAIFGIEGIDPLEKLSGSKSANPLAELKEQGDVATQHLRIGSLISGLIMFQVVLLTLMGSNNSAREIASERLIFEKEKFAGLHPSAYIGSKVAFLLVLVLIQSIWMGIFVNFCIPSLPGDPITRIGMLILVNSAMTFLCLGISGWMRSPEQASLMSIYLVGFQLPLSGAILALPDFLEPVIRPFISAYWAWSGNLDALKSTDYAQAVERVTEDTSLHVVGTCIAVLAIHTIVGLFAAYFGAKRHAWE